MTDELEQTKKELAALKEEYEEFAYIVSHDLSAPFRQIGGFAQIVAQNHGQDFDEKTRKQFEFILSGADKGGRLMEALLKYSRLNTKAGPFELIDLNSTLNEAKAQLSSVINVQNATISSPELPAAVGEERQITQLFYHLLHNALLYQADGNQPNIEISISDKADHWEYAIKDNGIGIHNNLKDKIFKVLRRGVTDEEYPGDGMGLALAKKIVQHHHGEIWLQSTPKHGSTFYFTMAKKLTNS